MTYLNLLNPPILNIFAASNISLGIVFNPPIIEKTRFQSIAKNKMKITAPSVKFNFMKATTTIGKKAKTGIDWIISDIGKRILSLFSLLVIRREIGIDKNKEKK